MPQDSTSQSALLKNGFSALCRVAPTIGKREFSQDSPGNGMVRTRSRQLDAAGGATDFLIRNSTFNVQVAAPSSWRWLDPSSAAFLRLADRLHNLAARS